MWRKSNVCAANGFLLSEYGFYFFYAERELLAGYYQNKHSTKLIAKIKLDLKSQKYFKDEASREHVYCFFVCVCASYSKHEQT